MTNDGIIEGHTKNSGCSDLSLAIGYAGRWTNIPDGDYLFGGSGATLRAISLRKPAIEKEARLRPQHLSFSRSRMGLQWSRCSCEGGGRYPASTIRLIFGSGETRHENAEKFNGWGAVGFYATPLLNLSMKYILLAVIGASVSYGQQFSGTGYNLNNGEFLIIQGSIDSSTDPNQAHRERMARYRQMNAELEVSIANMRAEAEMASQARELREQTELLRKISNE